MTPSRLQKKCMGILWDLFRKIDGGRVVFLLPDGKAVAFGPEGEDTPIRVEINTCRFFSRVVTGGDIGLGESYMAGEWQCADLPGFIRLLIVNRAIFSDGNPLTALAARIVNLGRHLLNRNSLAGSRRNMHRHYDLGNRFFASFLDESLSYSCGIFRRPGDSLALAQQNKLRAIIARAGISADHHVLDIGCGWGAFAIEAARRTGCRVTGITVSAKQLACARKRVAELGLADRIDIRLTDYRQLAGQYDRIVSIEMLEAVGHAYLGTFFKCCDRVLKPGGRVVIQTITVPDQHYDRYRQEADWIQKYIFPGACIPSLTALCNAMTGNSGLVVEAIENIGPHYAPTLRAWRRRFRESDTAISAMGFDGVFKRRWDYYLALCEAGFAEKALGDLQMVLARPVRPRS